MVHFLCWNYWFLAMLAFHRQFMLWRHLASHSKQERRDCTRWEPASWINLKDIYYVLWNQSLGLRRLSRVGISLVSKDDREMRTTFISGKTKVLGAASQSSKGEEEQKDISGIRSQPILIITTMFFNSSTYKTCNFKCYSWHFSVILYRCVHNEWVICPHI